MLDIVDARKAVRRSTEEFDDELESLMHAAVCDLELAGVLRQENDPLYDTALRMYLRGHFDASAPGAEESRRIYEDIKSSLHLSYKYTEGRG